MTKSEYVFYKYAEVDPTGMNINKAIASAKKVNPLIDRFAPIDFNTKFGDMLDENPLVRRDWMKGAPPTEVGNNPNYYEMFTQPDAAERFNTNYAKAQEEIAAAKARMKPGYKAPAQTPEQIEDIKYETDYIKQLNREAALEDAADLKMKGTTKTPSIPMGSSDFAWRNNWNPNMSRLNAALPIGGAMGLASTGKDLYYSTEPKGAQGDKLYNSFMLGLPELGKKFVEDPVNTTAQSVFGAPFDLYDQASNLVTKDPRALTRQTTSTNAMGDKSNPEKTTTWKTQNGEKVKLMNDAVEKNTGGKGAFTVQGPTITTTPRNTWDADFNKQDDNWKRQYYGLTGIKGTKEYDDSYIKAQQQHATWKQQQLDNANNQVSYNTGTGGTSTNVAPTVNKTKYFKRSK